MRKKILLLALALTSTAGVLSASLIGPGGGSHPCQQCTTLSNGAQCCISCVCNAAGVPFACAQNACAELP